MRSNLRLVALCFIATAAFGQHGGGGGFRGGAAVAGVGAGRLTFSGHAASNRAGVTGFPFPFAPSGFAFPERAIISPLGENSAQIRPRSGGRRYGGDFFPYFPFGGYYANDYPPDYNAFHWQPLESVAAQPAPPKPVHSVIHEYPENENAGGGTGDAAAFSIVLKDGSRNSAETVWVQDNQLHFVDSEGKHQVLSLDLIDRDTTERLNREKNLRFQLPPV